MADHTEIDRKVIYLMLNFLSAVEEMIDSGIGSKFFDKGYQRLVDAIVEEYNDSGQKRLLTHDAYRQFLLDKGEPKKNILGMLEQYDKCYVGTFADINDLGLLKKQLKANYVDRETHTSLQNFNGDREKKGSLVAVKQLLESVQNIIESTEVGYTTYLTGDGIKNTFMEEFTYQRNNPQEIIRCGIPEIDNVVNIGFRPGHITLFVAGPGGHKTNLLLNTILQLIDRGYRVLFIPLEMESYSLLARMVVNRAGVDSNALSQPSSFSDEECLAIENSDFWQKTKKYLDILEPQQRPTVAWLHREMKKISKDHRPVAVAIDYIDNLQPDNAYGQRHIEISEMLKDLRFFGRQYRTHILSAAQMGREAIKALRDKKDSIVDSTSIHGAQAYGQECDTIFALLGLANQPNRLKFITIKARHGPPDQIQELNVDPARYHISSTKDIMGTLESTELDYDEIIHQPIEEINAEIQAGVIEFNNTLDLPDDLSGIG